ncbi:MAG: DUF4249 family protein [Bacteroidota bacterium]
MKYILVLLSVATLTSACEEVIEVEVEDAAAKVVIEATLTDTPFNNQVILSQSGSYTNPGAYEAISGASVQLESSSGTTFELLEGDQAGVYQAEGLQGEIGESYVLSVETEGETYVATSTLNPGIVIDSVGFVEGPDVPFREPGPLMIAYLRAEERGQQQARFWVQRNGELDNGWYLFEGDLAPQVAQEFRFLQLEIKPGDTLTVISGSLDRPVYEYYYQLSEGSGGGFGGGAGTTPANPTNNLSGDALGYFGAMGITSTQVIVPE